MTDSFTHPKLLGLQEKIKHLQNLLLADDPKMPGHLRAIHGELIQYEELSHLLNEDEIAIILDAQQKKMGITLAAETTKAIKSKSGGIKNVKADDL
jgi:hypothetical protein